MLHEHGVSTELLDIDDVTDLSGYEAYVVGSGSTWATGSRTPVVSSTPTPSSPPSARRGCSPAAPSSESHLSLTTRMPRPGLVERLVEMTHAREHKLFAGNLDTSKLGLLERAAVRGAHASEGDHRDSGRDRALGGGRSRDS